MTILFFLCGCAPWREIFRALVAAHNPQIFFTCRSDKAAVETTKRHTIARLFAQSHG
jgi:hypothetical protein